MGNAAALRLALALVGGTIQWTHTAILETDSHGAVCPALVLRQEGDETAREVRAEFSFDGKVAGSRILPLAARGGDFRLAPDTPFADPGPGARAMRCRLRWSDGNGYPFSAVLAVLHRGGASRNGDSVPVVPDPAVTPVSISFATSGEAVARVTNRAAVPMTIRATLLLPDEIRSLEEAREETIPPGGEIEVPIAVESVGALPGARYTAFLLAEGMAEGRPVAGYGTVVLAVQRPEESVARWRPALGLIFLAAIVGIVFAYRRRIA